MEIPDEPLKQAIINIVKKLDLVPRDQIRGKQIGIDEFRKKYCGGKSAAWVRTFIFDAFPETDFKNGGWVLNPHKTPGARKTNIFEYEASIWMDEHKHDINWSARLEVG